MKSAFILSISLFLASCGSSATSDNLSTEIPSSTSSVVAHSDPRVATIRQQHEQLVALQVAYTTQLHSLTGYEKLTPEQVRESEGYFADYLEQSQSNLTALSQLDASKAADPARISLTGELAEKEKSLLERAKKRLANIHNEHYLPK